MSQRRQAEDGGEDRAGIAVRVGAERRVRNSAKRWDRADMSRQTWILARAMGMFRKMDIGAKAKLHIANRGGPDCPWRRRHRIDGRPLTDYSKQTVEECVGELGNRARR
jgi:hypothetical protein